MKSYIKLKKRIVYWDELSNLSLIFDKIEINNSFKNDDVNKVKIVPYIKVDRMAFNNVIALCRKYQTQDDVLAGLQSALINNVINHKTVKYLFNFQKTTKLSLSIPKKWRQLIQL